MSFLGGEQDETGSCGRLWCNVEVKFIDLQGKEIADEGMQGEVLLRPSLMNRYIGDEEATANSFSDNWLRTGDVAYCKTGKWYLFGRSKDVIKGRGWEVAQHPMVIDVAVIGIKSPTQESELPRVYVVWKKVGYSETPTEEQLKDFLVSKLVRYKALDEGVKIVSSLRRLRGRL